MDFISRESVIEIVKDDASLLEKVRHIPCFPAPNPNWQNNDKNVMGQTEDKFWDAVDR